MGKITVITGGTSGIGRGIAEKILAESAKEDRIFVTYGHDEKKAAVFRDSLPEEKKSQVILMKADMSSYDEMMAFVEELKKRGHEMEVLESSLSFGRGQIIWRDENDVLCGATEPRADGTVAAW